MKTSQTGIDLIKEFEGLELEAYRCSAGVWTIGYGHTSAAGEPMVTPDLVITEPEADQILRHDLHDYEQAVLRSVTVPLNQSEFDALVSWTFNLGSGALSRSTMLARLNAEDRTGAAEALTWWVKATNPNTGESVTLPGLERRRNAEAELFLRPKTDSRQSGRRALSGCVVYETPPVHDRLRLRVNALGALRRFFGRVFGRN